MKSTLNIAGIQRTIRALEQYNSANNARIEVGYFIVDGKSYGIRLRKNYYDTNYGDERYTILVEIQYPSTSGLVWVSLGEFSAVHPDSFTSYTPKIRIDRNWITYKAAPEQDQCSAEVTVTPIKSVVTKRLFHVSGEEIHEIADDFESQQFQHNLVCDDDELMDEEYNAQCMELVLNEFQLMYEGKAEITCIDIMPTHIIGADVNFAIPYDSIATEIENYVQVHQSK